VGGRCHVKVFKGEVLHVGERDRHVVHSYPSLTLTRGVEERRLDVQVRGVTAGRTVWVLSTIRLRVHWIVCFFNFIYYDTILIDTWTKYQILCLCLDLNVSIRCYLTESERCTYSENSLPSIFPRQTMIKFILEFVIQLFFVIVRVIV
jgi:hypothetical protein